MLRRCIATHKLHRARREGFQSKHIGMQVPHMFTSAAAIADALCGILWKSAPHAQHAQHAAPSLQLEILYILHVTGCLSCLQQGVPGTDSCICLTLLASQVAEYTSNPQAEMAALTILMASLEYLSTNTAPAASSVAYMSRCLDIEPWCSCDLICITTSPPPIHL